MQGLQTKHYPNSLYAVADTQVAPIKLSFALYRFKFKLQSALVLPHYAGTLWHSVLGAALYDSVCVVKNKSCINCMFNQQCDYTQLFAKQPFNGCELDILQNCSNMPSPHILRPLLAQPQSLNKGDTLAIDIILPGVVNHKLSALIKALYLAGKKGLGPYRSQATLQDGWQKTPQGHYHQVLKQQQIHPALSPNMVKIETAPSIIEVNWLSPYKPTGQAAKQTQFDVVHFIMAIIRRVSSMQYLYTGHKLDADFVRLKALANTVPVIDACLTKQKGQRYAAAQAEAKSTSGFMGYLVLDLQAHAELWPFLCVGEWLNVGKNASMGFGRYQLKAH